MLAYTAYIHNTHTKKDKNTPFRNCQEEHVIEEVKRVLEDISYSSNGTSERKGGSMERARISDFPTILRRVQSTFLKICLFLLYVYECFACMYTSVLCV